MGAFIQANFVQANFVQGGATGQCFDPTGFDPTGFDTSCVPSSGGGGRLWFPIPIIDNRQHDDELALLLLEAA